MRKAVPTAATANSFQARKGATGVIGHNLVDSLIYKQSLMKFLVFINNALQPRATLAPVSASVPGYPHPFYSSYSVFLATLLSSIVMSSSDTLYPLYFLPIFPLFFLRSLTCFVSMQRISLVSKRMNWVQFAVDSYKFREIVLYLLLNIVT